MRYAYLANETLVVGTIQEYARDWRRAREEDAPISSRVWDGNRARAVHVRKVSHDLTTVGYEIKIGRETAYVSLDAAA